MGFTRVDPTVCQRGDIELVAATCVSANKVRIDGNAFVRNGHTDVTVLGLLKLEKLNILHFEGLEGELTFNGGILPILKHFSTSLTSLSIEFLSNTLINICAIVENCPKLQTLDISYCKISPPSRLEDDPHPPKRLKTNLVLENLKRLELIFCRDLTVEDLDLLLASPSLNKLSLESIELPIDDCLRKAVSLHQFRNLQHLKFGFLIDVTKTGIDLLMNDGNSLKVVQFRMCQSMNVADIEQFERVAREKNWDVVFYLNNNF